MGDAASKVTAGTTTLARGEVRPGASRRPGAEDIEEDEYSEALAAATWRAKLINDEAASTAIPSEGREGSFERR